jgi:hypothetical protein
MIITYNSSFQINIKTYLKFLLVFANSSIFGTSEYLFIVDFLLLL